eukprot:1772307-Rhodomonas_salina.1
MQELNAVNVKHGQDVGERISLPELLFDFTRIDKRFQPRVCVPKKYRALILHEYHDTPSGLGAHFGEDKTHWECEYMSYDSAT